MAYTVISTLQLLSAMIISIIMVEYFRQYQRPYLNYWAKSFAYLSMFLVSSLLLSYLSIQGLAYHSLSMYAISAIKMVAGFLQILYLFIGCYALTKRRSDNNINENLLVIVCSIFAMVFVSIYAFDPDGALIRHIIRSSSRYIIGGLCFIGAAIYLYNTLTLRNSGQALVIMAFLALGTEMTVLGALSMTQYFELLSPLVSYHGAVELFAYSVLGLGLVMWLLDSERKQRQAIRNRLNYLGNHDPLTGLVNREGFEQAITQWQSAQSQQEDKLKVVLFGIDKFKRINEAGGVKQGDEVLVSIAARFQNMPHNAFAKARLTGDVFACLINDSASTPEQLERVRKTLSNTIHLANQSFHIDISVGAAKLEPFKSPETVMLNAQRALQQAKEAGGARTVVFSDLTPEISNTIEIENELRKALKNQEFILFLQQLYDVNKNDIQGFEALVRWQHPVRGVLSPVEFLPYLAQLHLMPKLDIWVLNEATRLLSAWRHSNAGKLSLAINLSTDGLNDNDYITRVVELSKSLGRDINKLHIEITETSAMKSIQSGKLNITKLHDLGITISLDDFGTGYSSLNYLKSFPADKIKFDHGFIKEMLENESAEKILRALVPLCQNLGKKVVAEGIETQQHLNMAKQIGFDQVQGYFFAKPMPVDVALGLLKKAM
jgi:diguanylate cyclase (GGDEF)-like protein